MFQEIDGAGVASEPMCDEFRVAGERITETFRRAGVDTRAGIKLPAVFQQAGLPRDCRRREGGAIVTMMVGLR